MSRKRIIYQSLALYAGQNLPSGAHTGNGSIEQLTRVQSFDTDFSRTFQDINQYGQLAARDRIEIEAPTVNMSTSWYPTDGSNEKYVGLSVYTGANQISLISGILNKETDEKNYFLLVTDEGDDAVGFVGTTGVIGVGNTFLTNYTLDLNVGEVPTASADFEALNFRVYASANGTDNVPAINPENGVPITGVPFRLPSAIQDDSASQVSVLRPGDVSVTISGVGGFAIDDLKIQSCSIAMDLGRTPIQKLGSRFPYTREIDFPLTATVSVEAIAGDLANFNLADMLCETGFYNLSVTMRKNDCSGNGAPAMIVDFKGAKITSESITTSIGDNVPVTIDYEVSIGSAQQLDKGIFISGSYV